MAAYAVNARIEGARPRRAEREPRVRRGLPPGATAPAGHDTIDLVGPRAGRFVGARWERVRELWAQTTFYLFDAESWRR